MPFPFLILSTLLSAGGSIASGMSSRNAAESNAKQMEIDRILTQAETLQKHADRIDEYQINKSTNLAQFASQGVSSSSMSVKAFLDKQMEVAFSDTQRSNLMGRMQASKLASLAMQERSRGRDALTAGFLGAFGTLAKGAYRYNYAKSSPPSGSSGNTSLFIP